MSALRQVKSLMFQFCFIYFEGILLAHTELRFLYLPSGLSECIIFLVSYHSEISFYTTGTVSCLKSVLSVINLTIQAFLWLVGFFSGWGRVINIHLFYFPTLYLQHVTCNQNIDFCCCFNPVGLS